MTNMTQQTQLTTRTQTSVFQPGFRGTEGFHLHQAGVLLVVSKKLK